MRIWDIIFFPPSGESHSPYNKFLNWPDKRERAQVVHRLETLRELEIGYWPQTWIHKITGKIFQLSANKCRVMFCLDGKKIVVLHICKKVSQKTRRGDVNRAETHYNEYMLQKKG